MMKMAKKISNNKGFTLIELIIVIAILGILAAVIIPRVSTSINTAKLNSDYSNAASIAHQIDLCVSQDNWSLPSDGLDGHTLNASTAGSIGKALVDNGYFDKLPVLQSVSGNPAFTVDIDVSSGKITGITVKNGSAVFYPKP